MEKIKMNEHDSIVHLKWVMTNACGISINQANAAVNAIERARHNQFGTIGQLKAATKTEKGRKELISILHLGPKRLGYIFRALDHVDIEYDDTDNSTPVDELLKNTRPKPRYSGVGRITLYFSKEVAGKYMHEVESRCLMCVDGKIILDGSEMTRPGLIFFDDDEMLPGFIRITDEFGYSRLFKKELLETMDIEMFDIEKSDESES